ncbi:MAG: hypothetical protein WKG01_05330 [Kofleriaceae bacterium]
MSVHVKLSGSLRYPNVPAATAALRALRRKATDNWVIGSFKRVDATLSIELDSFVSFEDRIEEVLTRIEEAAATATGGAINFVEDDTRRARIAAPRRRARAGGKQRSQ